MKKILVSAVLLLPFSDFEPLPLYNHVHVPAAVFEMW